MFYGKRLDIYLVYNKHNHKRMSIFDLYFDITKKYRDEYGNNTILLLQVGGFYEMYGLHDRNGAYIDKYSKFNDICLYCGLKMTDKELGGEKYYNTLAMAGFRTYSLEKYLKMIVDAGYVCVVYDQDEQKSGTTRSLQGVYTPGTYFDNDDVKITNTLTCCWVHKFKNIIVTGASCINVLTGQSYIYEYERLYDISPETFDELERFISTFTPNEIIIIHNIDAIESSTLVDLINIPPNIRTCVIDVTHSLTTKDSASNSETSPGIIQGKRAMNCTKQVYQDEIYNRYFSTRLTTQTTDLINTYAIASQSYCFLLDYVHQNNPHLVSNIELPVFENKSDRVVLGNHSLKQLNIIQHHSKNNEQSKYSTSYIESYSSVIKAVKKRHSSVCDLLNFCKTSMGTRLFYYTMTHPHSDVTVLNKIYDITGYCCDTMESGVFLTLISSLSSMCDMEKVMRKIHINRVTYDDISKLYATLREVDAIKSSLKTSDKTYAKVADYISSMASVSLENVFDIVKEQTAMFQSVFNTAMLNATTTEDVNIFNLGIYAAHDEKVIDYYKSMYQLRIIYYYLIDELKNAEKAGSKSKKEKSYKREPIKLNETERGSLTIELTNTRATTLSQYMAREAEKGGKNEVKTTKGKTAKTAKTATTATTATAPDGVCISTNGSELHKRVLDEQIIPPYLLESSLFQEKCFEDVYIDTDILFEKASSNGQKTIKGAIIDKIVQNAQSSKTELETSVKTHFTEFINDFKTKINGYNVLTKFCAQLDMLMCYTTVAKSTNYCRPQIRDSGASFCDLTNVRHPLIEHLLNDDLYVANSMGFKSVADSQSAPTEFNQGQGFLLYGTNTVGKSSFIKSVGVAVIMAQCGFYVAAESMTYKPYRSIFTRILGNDDLFRGLSTFNVEMIELKNILNYANEHSLVLGDEVCSGTEMGSASSIFMSALEHLYNTRSNFIFATHFHNIANCEEMKALTAMKNIHLSVNYDVEKDRLVYDRRLKAGAGENMYGLEVCKYLHLPDAFIKRSYEIRNKYFSDNSSILDLKGSKYNSKKLVGNCEQCGKKGTEVHHLQYQRNSDEKGFIKNNSLHHYFHKNQKANLMVLCDACHTKLHHDSDSGHYRVSKELRESA